MTTPATSAPLAREDLARLDALDPLARLRERFHVPADVIYLDGNSLGMLPRETPGRVARVVGEEWGIGLIRSWNAAGWFELPLRLGDKIGRLLGAAPDQTVVADSTSVTLFKALAAALALRPDRRVVVSERGNFPTDLHVVEGLGDLLGGRPELRLVDAPEDLPAALGPDVAALMLTHVDYRSGAMHDLAGLTARAHAAGALALWDLSHSAGVLPLALDRDGVDLAVGCGYKYLHGGPGAPAYLYVARRLHDVFTQPITGWMGHAAPFAFEPGHRPAPGIRRALTGTPPVLALAALEAGVDTLDGVDLDAVRRKSVALGGLLRRLVAERAAGLGLEPWGPEDPGRAGSQVSFRHAHAYPVMQALIARGVVGDFRAPDLLRFGLAPLCLRHVDLWDAVTVLVDVLARRAWDRPELHRRAAVT